MAYVSNTSINMLNLHYAVHALASGMGGIFYAVFLLRAGVPVALVLAAIAALLAGRFALRPLVLPLAKRWGLRPLVMVGCFIKALQFPILAHVHGPDLTLLVLICVSAVGEVLYWTTYHAYFAAVGDVSGRARQTSAREAFAALIGIVAPIIGGASLEMFGPMVAFGAVSLVLVLAALPLLGAPNVRIARDVDWKLADIQRALATFAAEGWTVAANIQVWQIVLFVTLSQSFAAYGGATALAALVGAFSGLFVGRAVDAGGGKRAAKLAVSAVAAVIVLRGLSLGHPALAVFAGAAGAFATLIYTPTLMTAMYNDSVSSPCPLRFQMATEGAFDVGCGACLILCAVTVALGGSLSVCVFFGLFGAAAIHLLLSRYYRDLSASVTSASSP